LEANRIWTCSSSGRSAHLGAAKQILDIASFKSRGHSLKKEKMTFEKYNLRKWVEFLAPSSYGDSSTHFT
jgi:hypothetical protein